MTIAALNFAFEPVATEEKLASLRLTIEGEPVDPAANNPSLGDLGAMLRYARSGLSARNYQLERCRWATLRANGVLEVELSCFVWPSRPELAYTVGLPAEVRPGPVEAVRLQRQWKYWVGGNGLLELPWRLEGAALYWQPGFACVDEFCSAITPPDLRHEYATIEVLGELPSYGVLVVQGTAIGFRHRFSLQFAKFDENGPAQSIELESVPVSATWTDEEGEIRTESADVEIPQCVRDLLATCADGRPLFNLSVKRNGAKGRDIAFSTCTGKMLAMRPRYKDA